MLKMRNPAKKLRLAKKSEPPAVVAGASAMPRRPKRRIQTGRPVLRPAGGLLLCGEIDGRAFFDLRLEHG